MRRVFIPIGVGVVFFAILGGAFLRYNEPTSVVRTYLQDTYDNEYSGALGTVCTGRAGENTRSYLEQRIQVVETGKRLQALGFKDATLPPIHIDLTHVNFTLQDESLDSSTVTYTGKATIVQEQHDAPTLTYTIALQGSRRVQASGLGWCISDSAT